MSMMNPGAGLSRLHALRKARSRDGVGGRYRRNSKPIVRKVDFARCLIIAKVSLVSGYKSIGRLPVISGADEIQHRNETPSPRHGGKPLNLTAGNQQCRDRILSAPLTARPSKLGITRSAET